MWIPQELYSEIINVMPIPCVDLVVQNSKGEILLLKRKNEPAQGEWWFPGGRIYFGESRTEAVERKLKEECGLSCQNLEVVGTYDLILQNEGVSHAITTIYKVYSEGQTVIIDNQSSEYSWKTMMEWRNIGIDGFIAQILIEL